MKISLKIVLLILCALPAGITRCAYGATPPCYPPEPEATKPFVVENDAGCAAVWYCDVGHKWEQWHFRGAMSECKYFVSIYNYTGLMSLSHAAKDALWNANVSSDPTVNADVLPALSNSPIPLYAPPSGFVTQDTKVYKAQQVTGGGFQMVQVGTVAPNKVCSATVTITAPTATDPVLRTYYGLSRTDVVMTPVKKWTPPFPNTAYGKCT